MNNRIILFVIIFLTVFNCKAQDKKILKLKANWKKGEVKEMVVQQSGSWSLNGKSNTLPLETTARYLITIVDKTAEGYIVEWRIINNEKNLEEFDFINNYLSQYKYLIKTDLIGNFKELSNWKELIELNNELKSRITSESKKEDVNQQELEKMIGQIKLAETKDELIEMCNGLTDIFHGSYSEELPLNDTILEPAIIPNQRFKEGVPATLETITKELDNNRVLLRYAYTYDYKKLKELHEKYFPNQKYSEQIEDSYSEFIYNDKTGWIEKITFYSEFGTSESKNIRIIEHIIK